MSRKSFVRTALVAVLAVVVTPAIYAQVHVHVFSLSIPPVSGLPFTALVTVENAQKLPDGSVNVKLTFNNIGRDSYGRTHNERRKLVSPAFKGTPSLSGVYIYDPETKIETYLEPSTHLARQKPRKGAAEEPIQPFRAPASPLVVQTDLGPQMMEGVSVHGVRISRTIAPEVSGTGKSVTVTEEVWYSDELKVRMLIKRDDPRTGRETVTLKQVKRSEPDPAMFEIPAGYKVLDETPES